MSEQRLPGGHVSGAVRVGDTVRRPAPGRAAYVADLLRYLERCGWPGAPRFLREDDGHQILTYVDGHVASERAQPPDVWSRESLVRVATLVRQFHDLTAGSWLAEDAEVVCHYDLSPANTVYRSERGSLRPMAFLGWDLAGPGERIHDVARVCWKYIRLGPNRIAASGAGHLMAIICDAYGLADRSALVATVLWWQDRCWRGIQAGADDGWIPMVELRDSGVMNTIREEHGWVSDHREELEAAVLS